VHTIQTTDASIVCADGHFAYTKCTCTTLSFLLDQFLGLLDGLSCCHYGGHLAVLVLSGGRLNAVGGAAKGAVLQLDQACNSIELLPLNRRFLYAPVLILQDARVGPSVLRMSAPVPGILTTEGLCCLCLRSDVFILVVMDVCVLMWVSRGGRCVG
jgi:hypothetical protein